MTVQVIIIMASSALVILITKTGPTACLAAWRSRTFMLVPSTPAPWISTTRPGAGVSFFVYLLSQQNKTHTHDLSRVGAGSNEYGQLGTGDNSDKNVPTRVSGGLAFAHITAGIYHTCALAI